MNPDTRHFPSRSPRRGRWLTAGLGLLAAITIASCSGDDGAPGQNGRDGRDPRLPIGRSEALPGFNIAVLAVSGGTGPNGNFQPGDAPRVTFTVKDDAGAGIAQEDWDRLQMYVSGPTFNYQRVIASTDVRAGVTAGANAGEWVCSLPALPANYIEPYNYTGNFDTGVLAGQPLLDGTYSIGIEGRTIVEVEAVGEVRDTSNVVAHFLLGSVSDVDLRDVVGEANCFQCHTELRAHGDNRTDLVGCLLCHTAGAEDGNNPAVQGGTPDVTIDFRVMIHKIHSGAHLPSVLGVTTNPDGTRNYDATPKPYKVLGFRDSVHDYSHVLYPAWPSFFRPMPRDRGWSALSPSQRAQEDMLRSAPVDCRSCHGDPDGDGPLEAPSQGDLIYSQASRSACTSCHEDWIPELPYIANGVSKPPQLDDANCAVCHPASGSPLAVMDAHIHPLVNPTIAQGVHFEVLEVTDAGGNGNGNFEPGERISITFQVKNDAGDPIPASSLSRIEAVISGPTTNPQILNYQRLAPAFFSGDGPYTVNMPVPLFYEPIGTSVAGLQTFASARAPHWNVSGAVTSLRIRTGVGASSTLAASARVTQNFIDVAPGSGTSFEDDDYIVLDDAVVGVREYMRVQWVEGDRLWFGSNFRTTFKPNLKIAHAAGAIVQVVTTDAVPSASWSLDPMTGVFTEVVEFGDGEILANYTTDFVIPDIYPGALGDSPVLGEDWGDWTGLPLLDGTYTFDMHGARAVSVTSFGEVTNYTEGAPTTVLQLLFGSATTVETVERVIGAEACNRCHVDLQFHGGSRRGYDSCINCHGTAGVENTSLYEDPINGNPFGTTLEFRSWLHSAHAGAFPALPGGVQNCASCHGPDNTAWKTPAERLHPDQTVPTRAWLVACISCHDSSAARAHADVNTSPATGAESCAVCHGAGKDLSVETVHFLR